MATLTDEYAINLELFGTKGLFTAILVALMSGMIMHFFSKERFKYIIILALFNYIFLGTEYLFDNIVGDIKPQSVVTAQSYILGASVLGFLFFAIIKKYINKN